MKRKSIDTIKDKAEARSEAIAWQSWVSTQDLSYLEVIIWQGYFIRLAKKFNLIREFKENCII